MAREARRRRAGRPVGQSRRPARGRDRRVSTGAGSNAIPARSSSMSSAEYNIRAYAGWRLLSTAWLRPPGRFSKPSSCCRGHFRKKPPQRSTCLSCSTTCGSSLPRAAVLSVITGGGKWVEIKTHADPLYQHLIVTAERKFWRCVESGEPPTLFGVEPPKPRIETVRVVDMTLFECVGGVRRGSSARTRSAHLEHEHAKAELKSLMPDDAQQAIGHGVRAKRSKSGAISFDLVNAEDGRAAV